MPLISIFITSRVDGNSNSNIVSLVDSIKTHSYHLDNIEILIKFDDDDRLAQSSIDFLYKSEINFKYKFGPRLRGYEDIHIGYNSLIDLASDQSIVFTCFADDFVISEMHWDKKILSLINKINKDIFIIHQRPHPPSNRKLLSLNKYNPFFKINDLANLYIIDEAPMWSRKLIDVCKGFGNISFTDAWTLYLEWYLYHFNKINITYFTDEPIIHRKLDDKIDGPSALRWSTARKANFEYINSKNFKELTINEVKNIEMLIKSSYELKFYQFRAKIHVIKYFLCIKISYLILGFEFFLKIVKLPLKIIYRMIKKIIR